MHNSRPSSWTPEASLGSFAHEHFVHDDMNAVVVFLSLRREREVRIRDRLKALVVRMVQGIP